jgi:hypothetical protein
MALFLVFPFVALFLAMLVAAALTFAVTATIPAFRNSAVTAPIAVFLISPALLFAMTPWIYGRMFIFKPPLTSAAFWIRFGTGMVLLSVGCSFAAAVATLGCRAVFQFVPPWLSKNFNLQPTLLLQGSILAGGSLSVLVLLGVSALLVYLVRENLSAVLLCGFGGLVASIICILGILRLSEPQCYQPTPLSGWVRRLLLTNTDTERLNHES